MKSLWEMLYHGGADVVINGHDHDYERFAPQDPDGNSDPKHGIREFVVGTGGEKSHRGFALTRPNPEKHQDETFLVFKLSPHPQSYDCEFVPGERKTLSDSRTVGCH